MNSTPQPVKLYIDFTSPPSLSVLALVLFNNIPHEIKEINVFKGDHTKPDFLKLNPIGTLPVLEDNGFVLCESHAIIRYLCNTKHVQKSWYPEDPRRRGLVDQYLDWHQTHTKKCSLYFMTYYAHVMPKAYFAWDAAEEKQNVIKALETLENFYLKNSKFIASDDEMTVADVVAVCEVVHIRKTKIDFEKLPKVKAWIEECMKRPEMQKVNKGLMIMVSKATARLHL